MLRKIKEKVLSKKRISEEDALYLFKSDDIFSIGEIADIVRRRKNRRRAYYIRNLHLNPTNICINRCKFCAFSRSKGEVGAFEHNTRELIKKISSALPITEVHIVGGLHPVWQFKHYLKILSSIKKTFPSIHIKAFTATEIDYFSKLSGLPLREVLRELRASGLDSIPGGGAEIFSPHIRDRLCPEKLSADRWLEVMETAHKEGIKSNATMLYGHIESYEDRIGHLSTLRKLQDRTKGFQAFIPLRYQPKDSTICGSGLDDLKTIAISRIFLDNFPHIKAYWVMLGEKIAQLSLLFGADDLDGTIIDEKIAHSAGGDSGKGITTERLRYLIKKAQMTPIERDSFYRKIR